MYRNELPIRQRILWQLAGLGLLLAVLYFLLCPLLAGGAPGRDSVQQALPTLFPWLSKLYWTTLWPVLPGMLSHISWLNPNGGVGQANLSLFLLSVASILLLPAIRIANWATREHLSHLEMLRIILLLTALFGVMMLFYPVTKGAMSQDMLLYGLYGRMVTMHHVNPYAVAPTSFPQDMLQMALNARSTAPYGPVWTDISILVTLLARNSIANILLSFRLIGFVAHLSNATLIWVILAKLKPEKRLAATLLYAWNPIILLLSIPLMHYEVVFALLILLTVLFFLRDSLILGWALVLLAVLVNPLALLLLPLFLRVIVKQIFLLNLGWRILWWLGIVVVSVAAATLAYVPYWQQGGSTGVLTAFNQIFWQQSSVNSLDAAIANLPMQVPAWLISPHSWSLAALITVGVFLLFSLWLADTLELILLLGSWLLVLPLLLQPVYRPWEVILPFALALCSGNRTMTFLAVLLASGALLSGYYLLRQPVWVGQGLFTVGLPFVIWGWTLFISSIRAYTKEEETTTPKKRRNRPAWLSRPSWPSRPPLLSRPSWPSWPGRR